MDTELFLVLGWASPIGFGIFIVCASFASYLIRKSRQHKD